MKYLSLLLICAGVTLTSCEKCGHCETTLGDSGTSCGKPDYDNHQKTCEMGGGTWVDE